MKTKSPFQVWFKREYNRWRRSQGSEEDFLAFCALFGSEPVTVISWIQGEAVPKDAEVLCIAGVLGTEVYQLLGLAKPDMELLQIFNSFGHLRGELRGRLAHALWDVEQRLNAEQFTANSAKGREMIDIIFSEHGVISYE